MSTITLRATKGSPLTNTEVDNNFSNLNTDKIEATYAGAMNSLTGGTAITTVSSTTGITAGAWKATVISPTYGGTGVAQASAASTITLGGALTMSGAYTFTGTLTGTTAVTFPTSGTLATTNGTFTGTWNGTVIAPNYGGTGVANGVSSTITLGGALTVSGAFATTLTVTGATSVTLPTTGTLATLAGAESLTNKKLGSLTSNGLVTTSGGDGTLSVTTTLGVATGGTGATSFTAGQVIYGNGTSALTSSANLTFSGTVLSVLYGSASGATYNANQPIRIDSNSNTGFAIGIPSTGGIVGGHYVNAGTNTYDGGWEYQGTTRVLSLRAAGTNYLSVNATGALGFSGAYGTSGQLLVSAGSGAVPVWTTATYATTGKAIAMAMVFGG